MNSVEDYMVIQKLGPDTSLVREINTDNLMITKKSKKSGLELTIATLMADNGIGPKIYGHTSHDDNEYILIFMENLEYTVSDLWPFITERTRTEITNKINAVIKRMHELDICHADLHPDNIMYTQGKIYIIDYGNAFWISTGETNPEAIAWRNTNFQWSSTYEEFVNYDYINWTNKVSSEKSKELRFSYENMDNTALISELNRIFGWKVHGLYEADVCLHYIAVTPGDEYYVDVSGYILKSNLANHWKETHIPNTAITPEIKTIAMKIGYSILDMNIAKHLIAF